MEQAKEIHVIKCPRCGLQEPPEAEIFDYSKRRIAVVTCPACKKKAYELTWQRIVPPYYADTERSKLPDQEHSQEALRWEYDQKGLFLTGPTRTGKSRTAWEILRDQIFHGRKVDHLDGRRLNRLVLGYGKNDESMEILDGWCEIELLLLDDVFKVKVTDRIEEQIFMIIDDRMQHLRPIIVTTNDDEESLLSRLSPDRGPALVERIKEMCHAITFTIP